MPSAVVFGPGVMGFYSLSGACDALYDREVAQHIDRVSGSSAGSIAAFLFAAMSVKPSVKNVIFEDMTEYTKFNIVDLTTSWGGIVHWKKFLTLVMNKMGFNPSMTMKEFYNMTKIDLHISAFNLHRARTIYFSHLTHPDLSIVDAMAASSAVPFVFAPVTIEGELYVDAAALEKYPLSPFLGMRPEDVLIVALGDNLIRPSEEGITNFVEFSHRVFTTFSSSLLNTETYDNFPNKVIIDTDINLGNLSMTRDEKIALYVLGFEQICSKFEKN